MVRYNVCVVLGSLMFTFEKDDAMRKVSGSVNRRNVDTFIDRRN